MLEPRTIRFATRKSPLALAQTDMTMALFRAHHGPDAQCTRIPMSTTGDERLQWSLAVKGGKGLFTSELERALVADEADIAVHSSKDLPTEVAEGLVVAGYLPRETPNDVLVLRSGCIRPRKIATGSPRRQAQLSRVFSEIEWTEIRGNVGTRLQKIVDGAADGTVMAMAGLKRLGLMEHAGLTFRPLPIEQSVPAAGQGAIAVQCRREDAELVAPFLCPHTAFAVDFERKVLAGLGGGCHSASAAHYCSGTRTLHVFHEGPGYMAQKIKANDLDAAFEEIQPMLKQLLS